MSRLTSGLPVYITISLTRKPDYCFKPDELLRVGLRIDYCSGPCARYKWVHVPYLYYIEN